MSGDRVSGDQDVMRPTVRLWALDWDLGVEMTGAAER
jgi:hypothetical protein